MNSIDIAQSLPIRCSLQVSFKHVVALAQQTRIQYCTILYNASFPAESDFLSSFFFFFFFFFFLSFSLLIGWQPFIWICCKPFLSLLYKCQLLCFWRLVLIIVVEVFPRTFSGYISFKDVYYKLVMPNCTPYP